MAGLDALAAMEYPGRFIILGREKTCVSNVVVYGITGRSLPSRARRLVRKMPNFAVEVNPTISTEITDPAQLSEGNAALLVYPAIAMRFAAVVSNGAQTNLLYGSADKYDGGKIELSPRAILDDAFKEPAYVWDSKLGWIDITSYEPDSLATPRISGVLTRIEAGLATVFQKNKGCPPAGRKVYNFSLEAGQGKLIATYEGDMLTPKPFTQAPLDVELTANTAEACAREVYAALGPKQGGVDVRVAVCAMYLPLDKLQAADVAIVNRVDLEARTCDSNKA